MACTPMAAISLVVPVRDEEDNLAPLHRETAAALDGAGLADFELIFVDDGSTDGTGEVLAGLRGLDPRVRVLRMAHGVGQSAAFAAGFREARGQVVITLDGDLQNDPRDVPRLVAGLASHDIVCGIRSRRADDAVRRATSRIANALRRLVTGDAIIDTGCSLKAFRREVLECLPLFDGMHRFLATLGQYAGARVLQLRVNHRPRVNGRTKYGIWNRLWVGIGDLLAVWWMRQRWPRYQVEELA